MEHFIVTANQLREGGVVFLNQSNNWSSDLTNARVIQDKDHANRLALAKEEDPANSEIVGPYAIPVQLEGTKISPLSRREMIRQNGPTISLPNSRKE